MSAEQDKSHKDVAGVADSAWLRTAWDTPAIDQERPRGDNAARDYPGTARGRRTTDRSGLDGGGSAKSAPGLDLVQILTSVRETAYRWNILTDEMAWESNAASILGLAQVSQISTATSLHLLIAPEHVARRFDFIGAVKGTTQTNNRSYRIQYRFMPGGRRDSASLWLEEHGVWHAGSDGRPQSASGVVRVINERHEEQQRLLYLSDHDELTGQLNRFRLNEALQTVITRAQADRQPAALLIAAIGNLASINDTFGFEIGDEVIASIGRRLQSKLRGGDTIGRYSSNKFGIILNDCATRSTRIAAERLLNTVREATVKTSVCELPATVSLGGVQIPEQAQNMQEAIGRALEALNTARARRIGCFVGYEPSPKRESQRHRNLAIADEIIAALNDNRMHLALQPIVSAVTRQPVLHECLLRLEKPDGTITAAAEFISVAEQLGLGRLVDRRALELAIGLLKSNPAMKLALNVSSLTTIDHEWLVALHGLTGGRRQLLQRLSVEITETAAIEDLDQTINFVDALKELGCEVAVDDFGAGYTSFRNLKYLAVDMVKIDGSFVKNLTRDKADRAFIETLVTLARTFKIETVAEWVGDEETTKILIDAGVDYLQGYHFGQPVIVTRPKPVDGRATG